MILDTNISALPRCHVVHFSPIPIHSKKFDTNTRRITRGGQVPLRTGGLQSISALRTPSSLIHEWFYWCTSWRWLLIKCSYLEGFQHIPTGTGWAINPTAHIEKNQFAQGDDGILDGENFRISSSAERRGFEWKLSSGELLIPRAVEMLHNYSNNAPGECQNMKYRVYQVYQQKMQL